MAHAEICPVCKGTGSLMTSSPDIFPGTTKNSSPKSCHGCNGKGWVEVSDGLNSFVPLPIPGAQPAFAIDPTYVPSTVTGLTDKPMKMCSHPGSGGKWITHPV